ncbi:hypothetical protein HYR53_10565 [Candidatus Acetothermia bacterium]|nr:hypothetical protein [Candidatus Acetothermia bacterium]
MKKIPEILRALDRLSSLTVQGRRNEQPGAFYGRMHYVNGMRRCAMELANWIVEDDQQRTKLAEVFDELHVDEYAQKLSKNGRALTLSVYLDSDLIDLIAERGLKTSDSINNALALYYLSQFRESSRQVRRESNLEARERGPFRCSLDEDLYERLEEQVSEIQTKFGVQKARSSIVNGALRLYLWVTELLAERELSLVEEPCGISPG